MLNQFDPLDRGNFSPPVSGLLHAFTAGIFLVGKIAMSDLMVSFVDGLVGWRATEGLLF